MASVYELARLPSDAQRLLAIAPEATTIASCLDSYIPIYSFSTRQPWGKAPKLARVDSLPVVPDFFSEPTCDSPPSLLRDDSIANEVPCFLSESGSFNGLPMDIYSGLLQHQENSMPDDGDAKAPRRTSPSRLLAAAAGGRAQPRRNPSDVMLSRCGRFFAADRESVGSDDADAAAPEVPSRSVLETALMAMWDDRADRGLFRYDVTQCPTRVLPGWLGFVAQLNEGRATKKRPTELTVDRVLQPFDSAKFNFKKAATAEALVAFCPQDAPPPRSGGGPAEGTGRRLTPAAEPLAAAAATAASPNLVLINVSPIDYGHVLLVPRVLNDLPQALSVDTVRLALQFARELGSPAFRVGYNSLGAYATINHLHFQSYYLAATLPCENAPTVPLAALPPPPLPPSRKRQYDNVGGGAAVRISRLQGYPVNAFVVEQDENGEVGTAAADRLEAVAAVVGAAAEQMQAVNQPFNLLISDAGRRVYVFPQCFAERQAAGAIPAELLDTGVNPAAFEIAGHLLLKRSADYEGATEELACRLLSQASLPEARFLELARLCFGSGGGDGP